MLEREAGQRLAVQNIEKWTGIIQIPDVNSLQRRKGDPVQDRQCSVGSGVIKRDLREVG